MPASEADLFRRLDELGIRTTTTRHAPVFTVEEARTHRGAIPGGHCKSLFLADKRGAMFLVVLLEDTRLDIKGVQAKLGCGRLSFASPERMRAVLGIEPGSVTPFAAVNGTAGSVQIVLDAAMMREALLNYHPLHNGATTTIASADLLSFLRAHGHEPRIVEL
jgi:Ala-tRNA(Pro) deacylase